MAGRDYCWWSPDGGKCWWDDEHDLCPFHRAFQASDPVMMGQALLENDSGRPPNGVDFLSSTKNDDGSWNLTFRARPDRDGVS